MHTKVCGIIETLSQLHVGASAGEESGNLNLIFRDQFTQTAIIPGSSIRGRMRSEMRLANGETEANYWYGKDSEQPETSESVVKFEYASLLWLPVFCPGQPIVWVTCPQLLKRYQRIAGNLKLKGGKLLKEEKLPDKYTCSRTLQALDVNGSQKLFFNFGFLTVDRKADLSAWFPLGEELPAVVVADDEIGMIHDMALYRQSRVALEKEQKRVKGKAFFNTEALPEGTVLVFPIAIRKNHADTSKKWQPFNGDPEGEIYLGGLESIGFGHCSITLKEV